jgi:hypothetical protein
MSNTPITAAQAKEFDIKKCLVYSNDQKTQVDIGNLITDLYYFEDVLSPCIKVDILFADTATVEEGKGLKTVMNALQLVGTEKVEIKLLDPNKKEISVTVYSDSVSAPSQEPRKSLVSMNLVSKEFIFNYKTVVNYRLDGKISDHVKRILTETFKTEKTLDIEETLGEYNYCGINHHGFATILTLAKKAIPVLQNAQGNTAGFFFYETSDGFKFKSVEGLLSENEPSGGKKKYKSLVYNETPDGRGINVPPEYGGKILEYNLGSTAGSVQSKLQIGTYSTRTILFDPFNCYYEVVNPNTQGGNLGSEKNLQTAGKNLPIYNKEFNVEGANKDYTRTQYMIIDTGSLPTGNSTQQLRKSDKKNFDPKNILSQSTMRYNQFFSTSVEITITGDFSFHAGDYIFIDSPQNNPEDRNSMDKQLGGYYVIAKLCHYISPRSGGYTKLTLSRDSIGRKGSPNPI